MQEIKEPINLKLFYSKKLANSYPYLVSYATRVQELLEQYKRASNGKLIVTVIDTEPFTEVEDEALNYGLQGVPLDGNGSELYFGIVASNSLTNKEIIPFLQPTRETYLEYDISQILHRLIFTEPIKVGIITDLQLEELPDLNLIQHEKNQAMVVWEQIQQTFKVQTINSDASEIPKDIKVLMLAHRADISNKVLLLIEQFVLQGGHVLAFIDPLQPEFAQNSLQAEKSSSATNLQKLLKSWGVSIPNKVFTCPKLAKKIRYYQNNKEYISNYPVWVDFTKEFFDKTDILTNNLERITLAESGIIVKEKNSAFTIYPLIKSDGDNMLLDAANIDNYKDNPAKILQEYKSDGETYLLAARITGEARPALSQGQAQDNENEQIETAKKTNIILFANTKMLQDQFWVNMQNFMGNRLYMPTSGNGNFVLNALDNLTGSNALISIRNRGAFSRPFSKIQNLQAKSKIKFKNKENNLMKNLEETKEKLIALENKKRDSSSLALSVEQKNEEEKFRSILVETRKELRQVQRELNKDIEIVEITIKCVNILLMPLLIFFLGCCFWLFRMRSSRQRYSNILYSFINVDTQ